MALTKRGQMIYDFFKNNPTLHPTAEEIYDELKTTNLNIGVATVYRNLKKLVELGHIKEMNLEKQGVRYDLCDQEHYHFICDTCGHIDNFMLDSLKHIKNDVEDITHGIITDKDLIFHGVCATCLNIQKN